MSIAGHALKANITTLGPLVLPVSEQLLFFINLVMRKARPYAHCYASWTAVSQGTLALVVVRFPRKQCKLLSIGAVHGCFTSATSTGQQIHGG